MFSFFFKVILFFFKVFCGIAGIIALISGSLLFYDNQIKKQKFYEDAEPPDTLQKKDAPPQEEKEASNEDPQE